MMETKLAPRAGDPPDVRRFKVTMTLMLAELAVLSLDDQEDCVDWLARAAGVQKFRIDLVRSQQPGSNVISLEKKGSCL